MIAWLKGLASAFVAGAAGGILLMIKDPMHFSPQHAQEMLWPCIAFGLIGLALYAAPSPFKKDNKEKDEVSKETLQRYQGRGEGYGQS